MSRSHPFLLKCSPVYSDMDTQHHSIMFLWPWELSCSTPKTKVSTFLRKLKSKSKEEKTDLFNLFHFTSVGLNFGVQIAWIAISIITMSLLTILMRKKEEKTFRQQNNKDIEKAWSNDLPLPFLVFYFRFLFSFKK